MRNLADNNLLDGLRVNIPVYLKSTNWSQLLKKLIVTFKGINQVLTELLFLFLQAGGTDKGDHCCCFLLTETCTSCRMTSPPASSTSLRYPGNVP